MSIGIIESQISSEVFFPDDLSGLVLWLDASDGPTIIESGGSVSQWDDKSGNNNDAIQTIGARQPTTDSITFNGLNVIDFDGLNDRMVGIDLSLTEFTKFIVFSRDVTTVIQNTISHVTGGDDALFTNSGTSVISVLSDTEVITGIIDIGINTLSIGVVTHSAAQDVALFVNGVADGTASSIAVPTGLTSYQVASFNNNDVLNGQIAEIVVYDRVLLSAERSQVDNYLANKWDITLP